MLDRKEKTCKNGCNAPRFNGRTICLKCINSIAKEKAKAIKMKNTEKVKARKEKSLTKKRFSRNKLIAECDRVFSLFIRERDKGKPCVTSGKPWREDFQCGHFASRKHLSTRWHEKNAHGQSPEDNMWGAGEQFKHGLAIDKMYGYGTAEQIMRLANSIEKVSDDEILHYIRLYYYELSQMGWTNEMIGIKKYYLKEGSNCI